MIDCHIHCLPEIDDGARNTDTTKKMFEMLKSQGVSKVVATPHFPYEVGTVSEFLKMRDRSVAKALSVLPDGMQLLTGAEVAVMRGISGVEEIEKLKIGNTNRMLFEFSITPFEPWRFEEVFNISYFHSLKPVYAHVERIEDFKKNGFDELNEIDGAIFQITAQSVFLKPVKKLISYMLDRDADIVIATDAHDAGRRPPCLSDAYAEIEKYFGKDVLEMMKNTAESIIL